MKRKIVKIDEEKCNGCGLCVDACHEGAIEIIGGKAKLVSESYCDGLGACLPHCPADAITVEEREAAEFDEEYARRRQQEKLKKPPQRVKEAACGCLGSAARTIERKGAAPAPSGAKLESRLAQWPCQIKLAPISAPYFNNANLLIAADCAAYAYAGIHEDFMRGRVTFIGCPKLDDTDYSEKLAAILRANEIKSITVLRMEVPCCGGIAGAVKKAIIDSQKVLPWRVVTISTGGEILEY